MHNIPKLRRAVKGLIGLETDGRIGYNHFHFSPQGGRHESKQKGVYVDMNEQTADSYYGYEYKETPVKTASTRSVCLLVVGLLGMVANATYALCSICPKLYFWWLQEKGEFPVNPETFDSFLRICSWSARASVLGCYIVLLVSHVKWRQSLTCWLGTKSAPPFSARLLARA